ncbi:MAG: ABC transporter substrate-binding protein [Dehalococcoidia bacterium]|nr:ABC transporter substrate-binding protein [Dehalococcoidia bacterium]
MERSSYWQNYWGRRFGRRRLLAGGATAGLGAAALLAGCGDDDSGGDKTATPGGSQTSTSGSPTKAAATPVKGGTLQLMKTAKDDGLDPAGRVVGQVWEQSKIYSWTHMYQPSKEQVQLDVAQSYETPDLNQITFKFRDGVNFQPEVAGGRPLIADDYSYSFGRVADFVKTKGGLSTPVLSDWIESITPIDKSTAVVKQKRPFFDRMIALGERNPFAIVAKEVIEANNGVADNVVAGSGPYRLTKHDDSGSRLERWAGYFKRDKDYPGFPKDGPYIDTIDLKMLTDPAAQLTGFLNGQFDIYSGVTPIDKLNLDQFKGAKGVVVQQIPNVYGRYIIFDMLRWTDPRAREAVIRAIDWEAYISTVLVGNGRYEGHVSGTFKGLGLPQDELKQIYKFDPQKAKALWQQAGNPFGGKLRAVSSASGPYLTDTEFFKGQLQKNLGVTVEIEPTTSFVTKVVAPNPKEWEFAVASASSYGAGMPETNALQAVLPNGYGLVWNFTLNSPVPEIAEAAKKVLDLYYQELAAPDKATRIAKVQELERYTLTNYIGPVPFPVTDTTYIAYRDRLKSYPYSDTGTFYPQRANDWWIE